MLVTVVVVFTVCTTPSLLFDFWAVMVAFVPKVAENRYAGVRGILSVLSYANSSVNVFIYYWTSE